MGGFRIQGKRTSESQAAFGEQSRNDILSDALAIQEAGAFAVVVEGVPTLLGEEITKSLSIPTIGIGAGPHCRGQILVIHDLLGLTKHKPKFAKQYIDLDGQIVTALKTFQHEVREGSFPDENYCYR
jgi:3-methyl-2-oxobutanoate hydroxymethyltransferase